MFYEATASYRMPIRLIVVSCLGRTVTGLKELSLSLGILIRTSPFLSLQRVFNALNALLKYFNGIFNPLNALFVSLQRLFNTMKGILYHYKGIFNTIKPLLYHYKGIFNTKKALLYHYNDIFNARRLFCITTMTFSM